MGRGVMLVGDDDEAGRDESLRRLGIGYWQVE